MTIDMIIQQKRIFSKLYKNKDQEWKDLARSMDKEIKNLEEIKSNYEEQIQYWKNIAENSLKLLRQKDGEKVESETNSDSTIPKMTLVVPKVIV